MNPLEYIRRDAEGSDSDTRRRAAADLVKSLTEKFPQEVTQLFTGYVKVCVGWRGEGDEREMEGQWRGRGAWSRA